jgi:hypothetical protein
MFCPRCGAENKPEQKYCRQCGLSLPGVRLALEGRVDEAGERLKKGEDLLGGGLVVAGLALLGALLNFFLSDARNWGVAVNLILGLLIAGPLIYKGLKRINRVREAMENRSQLGRFAQDQVSPAQLSPEVPDTDPLLSPSLLPGSVAEHTTLNLKQHEPRGRGQRIED